MPPLPQKLCEHWSGMQFAARHPTRSTSIGSIILNIGFGWEYIAVTMAM